MKIQSKIILLIGLFLAIGNNLFGQQAEIAAEKETEKKLVGVWQDAPAVGSGLSDNFQFFADGTYQFNYNQMDGIKRILSYGGKWRVEKDKLVLTIERMTVLFGGKLVKATGSIATDEEIEDGKVLETKLVQAEKLELNLEKFTTEEHTISIKIDGAKYWKLASDPRTYEN